MWERGRELVGVPVTALYDNLYDALASSANYDALVLISDGEDNFSLRHNLADVTGAAQFAGARLFTLGVRVRRGSQAEEALQTLAASGGGRMYRVKSAADLGRQLAEVRERLRSYYSLSFAIPEDGHDGRFHEVSLKVDDARVAVVRMKRGYFAPRLTETALSVHDASLDGPSGT